jgi:DNA-binding transcriptional LysR family regulator
MSVDGTEVIKQLVAEGLGIAVVSMHAVADQLAAGRLVQLPVGQMRIQRPFNYLTLHRRQPSKAAQAFLDMLGLVS